MGSFISSSHVVWHNPTYGTPMQYLVLSRCLVCDIINPMGLGC